MGFSVREYAKEKGNKSSGFSVREYAKSKENGGFSIKEYANQMSVQSEATIAPPKAPLRLMKSLKSSIALKAPLRTYQ